MKLKSGFILHAVGGEHVVVPVGARTKDFKGMIRLNDTGAFLWKQLSSECTRESIVAALLEEYDTTPEIAAESVDRFVTQLRDAGLLESND